MSIGVGRQEVKAVTSGVRTGHLERGRSARWAVLPLILLDAACVALSMWAAYWIRFHWMDYQAVFSGAFYARLGVIATSSWGIVFALYRLYDVEYLFSEVKEYVNIANACTMGLMGLIVFSFLDRTNEYDISRGWLALVWALTIASIITTRFGYRRLIHRLRERGYLTRRALIVGTNEEGRQIAAQLRATPNGGVRIVGFVSVNRDISEPMVEGTPVVGDVGELGSLIDRLGVEELIIIPTALDRDKLLNLYRDWGTSSDVQIRLSSGLYELFTTGVQVKQVGFVPLLSLDRTRITGIDSVVKAVMDYTVSLVGLVMLAPLFAFIALLIKLDSPGRAFYRRRVVGLHGQVFDAFKFRTMVEDAEASLETYPEMKDEWEQTGKIQNDPRITRVGKVLRRFSLDELPQLVNVLRGEMSLVGPRMITPSELRHFGRWQHNLLTVKPGLTGLWQVSGRSDVPYEERVRLDMYYIRNHTLWLDVKLLVNTVTAVLTGRGAY